MVLANCSSRAPCAPAQRRLQKLELWRAPTGLACAKVRIGGDTQDRPHGREAARGSPPAAELGQLVNESRRARRVELLLLQPARSRRTVDYWSCEKLFWRTRAAREIV